MVAFPWEQLLPVVSRFKHVPGQISYYELLYEETPADLERLIRQARPPTDLPQMVDFDSVIDRELVERT